MRSLDETQKRWRETQAHSETLAQLQRAVKYNGSSSPCISGCRSVCWKAFFLSHGEATDDWLHVLRQGRALYTKQRHHLLRFIEHPETLAELTIDPLTDDPSSPWNTIRQDEAIRAEILQDVQRLPDEANYHEDGIQRMILDILFVYCKNYPSRGGYRQGMHELLAAIVHVVSQDALDATTCQDPAAADQVMVETLDAAHVEHDAYCLFSKLMSQAQSFYEVQRVPGSTRQDSSSAIIERSRFIHEVCLAKVDPELAAHLTNIEILPQIFLIRWIRLIFSREFPFDQFLILWDTIFAVDSSLELIDLICVAMLTRIRWQLLEADYSVCLQLLLKYPSPSQAHGPHTFVDDAVYLRDHLNDSGGATLIMKYTGRMPNIPKSPDGSRPTTPSFSGFQSFRQKGFGARSPLHSPTRFIQQQGGMEALLQGAAKGAKGVLERSEKLGISQAVRDAMGEIRKNMQGLNDPRSLPRSPRIDSSAEAAVKAVAAMERRNKRLADMLDETVTNLRAVSASNLEDKAKSLELIDIAAAKVQFVQIYLADSSMDLPGSNHPVEPESMSVETPLEAPEAKNDAAEGETTAKEPVAEEPEPPLDIGSLTVTENDVTVQKKDGGRSPANADVMDTDDVQPESQPARAPSPKRPNPIPTRSTLAQSSFSWMLEPGEPHGKPAPTASRSPPSPQRKRGINNASREKNAFLFGEVVSETSLGDPLGSEGIFGMQPLGKNKKGTDT
ncbi:rab-GTPase-TBC domain-containing protein [Stachybotrys elegans]|uniref:Rab-GTPase-TBC domain-containing protein n=1 Tax=Stachybotrys elegans TaxID=80388 RepID=A0A8K0T4F2_9HYPO|nr:rab-GTPase-TBC domain-containing protein [Stachybotrys elegans]